MLVTSGTGLAATLSVMEKWTESLALDTQKILETRKNMITWKIHQNISHISKKQSQTPFYEKYKSFWQR